MKFRLAIWSSPLACGLLLLSSAMAPFHVSVKLEDFRGPEYFDAAKWRITALVDVSTANGGEQENNTLWIANFQVK